MSMIDTAHISCPDCGLEGQMTLWSSLNVSIDPELKDRVLDQSLFRYKCKHCEADSHPGGRDVFA